MLELPEAMRAALLPAVVQPLGHCRVTAHENLTSMCVGRLISLRNDNPLLVSNMVVQRLVNHLRADGPGNAPSGTDGNTSSAFFKVSALTG